MNILYFILHIPPQDKSDFSQFISRREERDSRFVTEVIAVSTNASDVEEDPSVREQLQQLFLVALLLTVCGLLALLLLLI